jgi:hypothetical protein
MKRTHLPTLFISLATIFSATYCTAQKSGIVFEDVTKKCGLNTPGRTAAWTDLNGDGWTDLVADGIVWKNNKGTSFSSMAKTSGITGFHKSPCVIADFNGDGKPDIYFVRIPGALYLNEGNFKFKKAEIPANPTGYAMAAGAADIDNDGWVDVYVANYEVWKKRVGYPDIILRNNKGKFEIKFKANNKQTMRGRGVTFCDFNNDGNIDFYVSNYRLMPNFLWVNFGNWKIIEMARKLHCAGTERRKVPFKNSKGIKYYSSGHTIGSVWADFDNDLLFDLFVGNFSHPPKYQDRPQFLRNGGAKKSYVFIDKSKQAGIPWQESYASPAAGDVDNDGLVDVFFTTVYKGDTSRLFRNTGNWKFKDVTKKSNIQSSRTYQAAFADFDNDGRLDLITKGKLYRNVSPQENHWLKIKLFGKQPNTMAIGAKVIVTDGKKKYIRQVEAGTGSGNQNDSVLHYGLGKEPTKSLDISVIWPGGKTSGYKSKPNQHLKIIQK